MLISPPQILLTIAAVATLAITVDGIIESGLLVPSRRGGSHLAQGLTALWKHRQQEHLAFPGSSGKQDIPAHFVTLPIDHEDPAGLRFENRYWVNTEFYRPGGPIFVHDVGEVDATVSAQRYLAHPSSYLRRFLAEFGAIGIVWEHRCYGQSLPFPVSKMTPVEHFRFLTLNQSLADLPYFAQNFSLASFPYQDLTPRATPWIIMGCSYSGLRAAISRDRYPETFLAAYAASAPVQLRVDHDTFFEQIYRKLVDRGHQNCTNDMHAIVEHIDRQLADPRNASSIKQKFLGPGAEANSNGDFTVAIFNIYAHFQSQGLGSGEHSLASFCDYLEWDHISLSAAGPGGLVSKFGVEFLVDRFALWPSLLPMVNKNFNTDCAGLNTSQPTSCELGKTESNPAAISWEWQLCSELGLFSTQHPTAHAIISSYQTMQYRQSLCSRQFPDAYAKGLLDIVPAAAQINSETRGHAMRPSNVFWTAGQYDPWRDLTPLMEGSNYTFRGNDDRVGEDLECNAPVQEDPELFGHVFEDAQHCVDYDVHFEPANQARDVFSRALKGWLQCFGKSNNS